MSLSIRAAASEHPLRTALIVDGEPISYAQLAARVERAIGGLLARGAAAGTRVAFVAEPRLEPVVLLHALFELGACAVPLHPRLTPAERTRLVEDAAPCLRIDEVVDRDATVPQVAPAPEAPLALLYTSGSTGRPKGVLLSRAAFTAAAAASAAVLGFEGEDRWLLALPFAHVGGLSVLVRCLLARRTVVLERGGFDPERTRAVMVRERVTLASLVPTQLRRLLDLGGTAPTSLRAVLLGGAAAPAALVEEASARGWPVLPTYGLTEACAQVATRRLGAAPRGPRDCGPPLPTVEVRVREGAIEVRGPTLLSGYFPSSAHPPALTPDGWLRTDDAGFIDEAGHLHVLGRRDRTIVTGGENVAPVEVEEALCACEGVQAAWVWGLPDETWGQVVVAALVARGSTAPDDDALAQALATHLSPYKRPRHIAWLPVLPTTAAGKPDGRAIAATATPLLRPFRARTNCA